MAVDWTKSQESRADTSERLDKYTVPDFPYDPETLKSVREIKVDRFSGYRALEPEDWNNWQKAIEDASS